jgi:hypothetical protein
VGAAIECHAVNFKSELAWSPTFAANGVARQSD